MAESSRQVTGQMQQILEQWKASNDQRAVFLSCYLLMTRNMVSALDSGEFIDPLWVDELLRRFAGYYFSALTNFENQSSKTPAVWQLTFEASKDPETMVLQNLFLGVNAHINHDLVLTLKEILEPEWHLLSKSERDERYLDHCQVNKVIERTIDSVQETVIEAQAPVMDAIDKLFGPLDEKLASWLIGQWRDEVWEKAVSLVEAPNGSERKLLRAEVEDQAFKKARLMLLR